MKKNILTALASVLLLLAVGCTQGENAMPDNSRALCGDKPNCVSTLDSRKEFNLMPFQLTSNNITIDQIVAVAMTLPGAKLGEQRENYVRVECVSQFFRFVDDLELRIDGNILIVRSVSRLGYSDFGVNRKRADTLRQHLKSQELIN